MKHVSVEKKAMLAALIAYSIFGLSYLFSKMAMDVADPIMLLAVRFSVTVIVLNLLVLLRAQKLTLKGKNLFGPILLGILQPVLYFLLENYGLKYTTTSFTGLISAISPVFAALLGVVILKEKPNFKQWICITISIAGVMLVSVGTSAGENTWAGCICLLSAYLIGSLYSVFLRHLSKTYSAFELTYIMFHVGFLFFAGLVFMQNGKNTLPMIVSALSDGRFLAAILYLGAAASVGAYLMANYATCHLPVSRSTIFSCFATVVSVLSGVFIMNDPFTVTSGIAMILILVGVYGVNRFAPKDM